MHPAIIIGTVRSLWTWLWGRYHVPQNVFLVLSKFDCHGNFLCSLKIPDSIFEFADQEDPTIYEKDFTISLYRTEICAILPYLPKFGCHGNSLASLKILDSIFEFAATPKILPYAKTLFPNLVQN